jgi:hypothetical protein
MGEPLSGAPVARCGTSTTDRGSAAVRLRVTRVPAPRDHESCSLAAPDPPTMTSVVAVGNYLVEHSEAACADADFHAKAPSLGSLSMDKPTFDWLIRAADVDVRLLTIAFGV